MDIFKQHAANAALDYIEDNSIIGVGTGSTVNYFIDELVSIKNRIEATVASSKETAKRLQSHNIPILDLNAAGEISLYVDSADEINHHLQMIKGGGGALTGEKIIASASKKFICIADQTKYVELLGKRPVVVEVIPMARSYAAREIVKLGGDPVYRQGFTTDYGNIILDIYNLDLSDPEKLENILNSIAGVVINGIFAKRPADLLLLGTEEGVKVFTP